MKSSFVIVATVVLAAAISGAGLGFWTKPRPSDEMVADPIVLGTIPMSAGHGHSHPAIASLNTSIVSPPAIFSVSNFTRKTVCLVERGATLTSRSRAFFAPPDCEQVWPGLTLATTWTQNEDGSVTISDTSGGTLLTLVRGRHFSYEVTDTVDADLALLMLP